MSSPKKPARKKEPVVGTTFQTTAQLHEGGRSTNFSFKKDFVKDSMVVLGPERTFKLRNPLVSSPSAHSHQLDSSLLNSIEDGRLAGSPPGSLSKAHRYHVERDPSCTRSYSLSSYDEIVRDASKRHGRRRPSNQCFCLLAVLFCLGIGVAFGIYFGLVNNNGKERVVDLVYRGSFRIMDGDSFTSELSDAHGSTFHHKARDYQDRLDGIFRNSSMASVYQHSEILSFEGHEGYDLSVYFNLHCWMKKGSADAAELEAILREELGEQLQPANLVVDPNSIEVRARSAVIVKSSPGSNEGLERRTDPNGGAETTTSDGNGLDSKLFPLDPLGGKKGVQLLSRPSGNVVTPPPAARECQPVSLNFCRNVLGYNFTSWPNLLGHRSGREIQRFNEAAKLLVESECSPNIQQVLCHILQPPCDPEDMSLPGFIQPPPRILPPCRSICMAAASTCHARLGLDPDSLLFRRQHSGSITTKLITAGPTDGGISLKDLLRCELFPVDDGMGSCTAKPALNHVLEAEPSECVMFMTAHGQGGRVCDGHMDCHDFSDEVACSYCPEGQVHCGVGAACIDVERRCDGVPDCPNGSDERGCLTVAPDMAAANFVHQYFHEGYIVFTEGNNTGKICVDSLNATGSTLSLSRQQSFLEVFGESACRSMSYRIMERIEVRTDNERTLDYAHLTEPIRWRATFLRAPCRKRQVLYLSCSGLECGTRPVHMHPDRPGSQLTLLPSAHGDWPWLAALIRDGVHACDATLIADQWLITSSTCFDGQSRAHWVARFAAVRLTSDAPWEQERRIIGMVKSPMKGNLLVLIKMESAVIYSDFVRPVCLARDHEPWIVTPGSRCLYLGWGKDRDNLHEVTASVVSSPKCDNVTTLCADVLTPTDACRNDEFSGSPFLCQMTDGGPWSLVGVSNENRHCERSFDDKGRDVRVYLGVSTISDWVMQTVRR